MTRRLVQWTWEDPEAQAAFAEWVGFPDAAATTGEVDAIEGLIDLRRTERILDVGCGNGRHALELAKRGYRVVGIDIAVSYLRDARQAAEQAGLAVEFRRQRASEFLEEGCYDAAIAINHTLGFMDDEELGTQFRRIARALRPEGKLVLKTAGPQCFPGADAGSHSTKNWAEKAGRFILSEKRMEGPLRIEHNVVIDTEKREIVEYHEEQRAFTRDEVVRLIEASGFKTVRCLKNLSGNPATDRQFGVYVGTT